MSFELNAQGLLRRPNLHDGQVIGLNLLGKKIARVTAQASSGRTFIIEFSGLERLLCTDFLEGNIIGALIAIAGTVPPKDAFLKLLGELDPSAEEPHQSKHKRWIDDCVQRVVAGAMTFVEIAPSYGCEILALCERMTIEEVDAHGAVS